MRHIILWIMHWPRKKVSRRFICSSKIQDLVCIQTHTHTHTHESIIIFSRCYFQLIVHTKSWKLDLGLLQVHRTNPKCVCVYVFTYLCVYVFMYLCVCVCVWGGGGEAGTNFPPTVNPIVDINLNWTNVTGQV